MIKKKKQEKLGEKIFDGYIYGQFLKVLAYVNNKQYKFTSIYKW